MSDSLPLLVVDDNPTNRDMLSRRLVRAGFSVELAEGAKEALDVLSRTEVDLVLLDSMMPDISGIDLLKMLRATKSPEQLPVIMVTANSESVHVVEALNLGANDYVTKPIDFPVTLARIRAQLTRKRAEEALRVSEERYSLAVRGANDGVWDWDLRSNQIYYSERWKEMLGLQGRQLTRDPEEWLSRIHPDERATFELELHKLWRSPQETEFAQELRMAKPDGQYAWMLVRGHVLRDPEGRPVRMAGSQTDVTANKSFDALTGFANRTLLSERVAKSIERERNEPGYHFGLLFLDLDRFKVVNDSMGHLAGDRLLVAFSERLTSVVRQTPEVAACPALLARLGGDEFAVLIEKLPNEEAALQCARRISEVMRRPFDIENQQVHTSASIGIAFGAPEYTSPTEVLRDADTAMYRAKALGKARFEIFNSELRAAVLRRLELETQLRGALSENQFQVVYQPKVSLSEGKLVGFEALLRWKHPVHGMVMPSEFIPIAEETGLIVPIGVWVLREACIQLKQWQSSLSPDTALEMSVNLSPKQFHDPDLLERVSQVIAETQILPHSLQLEVTEGVLIDDKDRACRILEELKSLGVGIKFDDFGTGYSALSYLTHLPCDSLKIDRSFVSQLCQDDNSLQVVKTIISLGRNLGIQVTAEGVETGPQANQLRDLGCEFAQGYFFSRPVSAEDAGKFVVGGGKTGFHFSGADVLPEK